MNITLNWWDSKNKIEDNDHCIEQINDFSRKFKLVKKMYENWKVAIKMISWRKLEWREYENFINEYKKIQKEYDDYFNTYDKIITRYENDERETWSIVVDTLEKLKRLYVDFSDLSDELENICFDNEKIEDIMYDVTNTKFALREKENWNLNGEYKEYLQYAHYLK